MKIAIIILNWNGWRDTIACLSTLLKLKIKNEKLKIIVVDNGSEDESVRKLKVKSEKLKTTTKNFKVKVIENKENLGFAEGNNIGIRYALKIGADYIMLLNNDTLVDKNLIVKLIEAAGKDKKIGIIGPKIYFAAGKEFHYKRYKEKDRGRVVWYAGGIIDWNNIYCSHKGVDEVDKGQYNKQGETDFASGCCMMIKNKVFEKIGFLDKKYFLYLEDVDFCLRAKKAGFKIVYFPFAFLWHKNAQSSGKPGSSLHVYYQTRNRLIFGIKYASFKTKLALLKESLKLIKNSKVTRKAVLDFYLGRFGKR